ncbi:rRNA-processing protein bfr2 [Tieghemiomyces parasiticus]|uniref:Protein BFR2 n=1 Tax=Tieghemiomyces parasiticus TaxID=78921 RepID=A0A9W8AFW4_9FUNG|nr:rRNA-processing protein bfr2 [Tieghemiomyces parasiticus]
MPPKKSKNSLKGHLASMFDPTPEDYDPEDFERAAPENNSDQDSMSSDSGSESEMQHDTGRSHYVKVGKSKLRGTENLTLNDPKYVGKAVSRKSLFEDSDAEDLDALGVPSSDSDDDSDSDNATSAFDLPDDSSSEGESPEGEAHSDEDVYEDTDDELRGDLAHSSAATGGLDSDSDADEEFLKQYQIDGMDADSADDDSSDNDDNASGSDENTSDDNPEVSRKAHGRRSTHKADTSDDEEQPENDGADRSTRQTKLQRQMAAIESEEKSMLERLAREAQGDVHKGRAVVRQIKVWNALLDSRIRIQKALTLANCLPRPADFTLVEDFTNNPVSASLLKDARRKVGDLVQDLLALRSEFWELHREIDIPATSLPLKRKRGAASGGSDSESERESDDDDESELDEDGGSGGPLDWSVLDHFHQAFVPFRDETLEKWGAKVQAASGVALHKKLRAFNQSAVHQAQQTLADRERLVERTQVKRTAYPPLVPHIGGTSDSDDPAADSVGGSSSSNSRDVHIFDDHDFYQSLLRELIESRTGGGGDGAGDPTSLAKRWATLKEQQAAQDRERRNKAVDTKASKGRRLRYNVHEKLLNFMAPTPSFGWHAEMIDELYSTLLGQDRTARENSHQSATEKAGSTTEGSSDDDESDGERRAQREVERLQRREESAGAQAALEAESEQDSDNDEVVISTDGLKIFG